MKNIKHTLKKIKHHEGLSPQERTLLRTKLNEYRDYAPLTSEHTALPLNQKSPNILFFKYQPVRLMAALLIATTISGGTAFAAEGALPGDILYSVKTGVNENVRGALALSTEAKATFNTWRATRRLSEAQHLAARGELSDETKVRLATSFDTHAREAQKDIDTIEERDPSLALELSTQFEASLLAHEALLAETDATGTAPVQSAVRNTLGSLAVADTAPRAMSIEMATFAMVQEDTSIQNKAIGGAVAPANSTDSDGDSAARVYTAAEKSLTETQTLYAKIEPALEAETQKRISVYLKATTEIFTEGERYYKAESYTEALTSFQAVVRAMSYLSIYLTAQRDGTIDINQKKFPTIEPHYVPTDTTTPLESVFIPMEVDALEEPNEPEELIRLDSNTARPLR